jgi:CRP-like cAMP-binding protein
MDFREDLRPEDLVVLENCGRKISSRPGERLSFDPHHDVLFILNGGLHATAVDAYGKTFVRMYAAGEVLNELSVLTAQVSLLSVTALTSSVSLLVSQGSIDSLVSESPKVAAKLFRHFAKRIIYRTVPQHANSPSSHSPRHAHDSLSEAC